MASSTNKTTTIKQNECFVLPKGAVVTSVSGILTNSCSFDLPTPEALKCYSLEWEISSSNGAPTHPWDHEDTDNLFKAITLNGASFPISVLISEPNTLKAEIANQIGNQGVIAVSGTRTLIAGDRELCRVIVKTLPSIAANLNVSVDLSGSNGDIRIFPKEITCP